MGNDSHISNGAPRLSNRKASWLVVGGVGVVVLLLALARLLPHAGPRHILPDVDDVERAKNLMADIFTVARGKALDAGGVVIADIVKIDGLDDIAAMGLAVAPTPEQPEVYGYRFEVLDRFVQQADQELRQLRMAPIIAWPVGAGAQRASDVAVPVILGDPRDGYRMGAKSLRVRWLTPNEIADLRRSQAQPDLTQWAWFDRQAVHQRLVTVRAED